MRTALESLPRLERFLTLETFPRACCGDASLLLGAYLSDHNFQDFRYICGERGDMRDRTWTSHAWLACGSLIVDITADQFPDGPGAVIVSTQSPWHAQFDVEPGKEADFRKYSGMGVDHLHHAYAALALPLVGSTMPNTSFERTREG
jgi:hypothetical protein